VKLKRKLCLNKTHDSIKKGLCKR